MTDSQKPKQAEKRPYLCQGHRYGFGPTQERTHDPDCVECVRRGSVSRPALMERKFEYGRSSFPRRFTGEQMREMRRKERELARSNPARWAR